MAATHPSAPGQGGINRLPGRSRGVDRQGPSPDVATRHRRRRPARCRYLLSRRGHRPRRLRRASLRRPARLAARPHRAGQRLPHGGLPGATRTPNVHGGRLRTRPGPRCRAVHRAVASRDSDDAPSATRKWRRDPILPPRLPARLRDADRRTATRGGGRSAEGRRTNHRSVSSSRDPRPSGGRRRGAACTIPLVGEESVACLFLVRLAQWPGRRGWRRARRVATSRTASVGLGTMTAQGSDKGS
jgi:hypothetical protein